MDHRDLATAIEAGMELDTVPIGIAFLNEPPDDVAILDTSMPSACALWRRAEKSLFYAPAKQHFNCAVGAFVMGFELPERVRLELGELVENMCKCNYIEASEPNHIPVIKESKAGMLYGPVARFPHEPDLILLWLTPKQAMLYSEAAGNAKWIQRTQATALGRPACAALPLAISERRPTLSLGCIGMRTFTEIADSRVLAVLPVSIAEEFIARFRTCVSANEAMRHYYEDRKAQVAETC